MAGMIGNAGKLGDSILLFRRTVRDYDEVCQSRGREGRANRSFDDAATGSFGSAAYLVCFVAGCLGGRDDSTDGGRPVWIDAALVYADWRTRRHRSD
jgi:hypothetical protein